MKGTGAALMLLLYVCLAETALAREAKFDFRFPQNSGAVVVIDSRGEVGKSNISIETLAAVVKKMKN